MNSYRLVTRPGPGHVYTEVTRSVVARDIAIVANAMMRLPNPPVLKFEVVEGTKLAANRDVHANVLVRGAKFIHRDRTLQHVDEYLRVFARRMYSTAEGQVVEVHVAPEHNRDQRLVLTFGAADLIELFEISSVE